MTEHKYWSCDRCGRNNEKEEIEIFHLAATTHATTTTTSATTENPIREEPVVRFDLCIRCFREFLSEWGKNLLKWQGEEDADMEWDCEDTEGDNKNGKLAQTENVLELSYNGQRWGNRERGRQLLQSQLVVEKGGGE